MSDTLIFAMPGNDTLAAGLAERGAGRLGKIEIRSFPDGESHLRFVTDPKNCSIVLVCTLDHPNSKILPLLFAAQTAKGLGAKKVGLVAPYLCYMRQDRMFESGDAVSARLFATLVCRDFDWLATVDPHLHRIHALPDIYSIPCRVAHAAPLLAHWIKANVASPYLIGPDEESGQWVEEVAHACGGPYALMRKTRLSDRDVTVAPQALVTKPGDTPVLLDDMISTGHTVATAIAAVRPLFQKPPVVVATHGLLADDAAGLIHDCGATLVTTNSIAGPAADIDISGLLSQAICALA